MGTSRSILVPTPPRGNPLPPTLLRRIRDADPAKRRLNIARSVPTPERGNEEERVPTPERGNEEDLERGN